MVKEQLELIIRYLEDGSNSVSPFEYRILGIDAWETPKGRRGLKTAFEKKAANLLKPYLDEF